MTWSCSESVTGSTTVSIHRSGGKPRGAWRVWVALRGQEPPGPASFAGGDSLADVALLSIRHAPLRPLSMTSEIPPVGAPVIVVGTPLGLSGTVTEGILSAVRNPSGRA